jgi:hypothetical protein
VPASANSGPPSCHNDKGVIAKATNCSNEDGRHTPRTRRVMYERRKNVRRADSGVADGDRDEVMLDVLPPSRRDESRVLDTRSGGRDVVCILC